MIIFIESSWGPGWAEEGYFYLPRGQNKCGINTLLAQPVTLRYHTRPFWDPNDNRTWVDPLDPET